MVEVCTRSRSYPPASVIDQAFNPDSKVKLLQIEAEVTVNAFEARQKVVLNAVQKDTDSTVSTLTHRSLEVTLLDPHSSAARNLDEFLPIVQHAWRTVCRHVHSDKPSTPELLFPSQTQVNDARDALKAVTLYELRKYWSGPRRHSRLCRGVTPRRSPFFPFTIPRLGQLQHPHKCQRSRSITAGFIMTELMNITLETLLPG